MVRFTGAEPVVFAAVAGDIVRAFASPHNPVCRGTVLYRRLQSISSMPANQTIQIR
jgi:hypothetical protein